MTWKDFKTQKGSKAEAKILTISNNENELHKLIVTTNGNIHDLSKKIFSADVMNEHNQGKISRKIVENIRKSTKRKIEEKIANKPHILSNVTLTNIGASSSSSSQSLTYSNETFPTESAATRSSFSCSSLKKKSIILQYTKFKITTDIIFKTFNHHFNFLCFFTITYYATKHSSTHLFYITNLHLKQSNRTTINRINTYRKTKNPT